MTFHVLLLLLSCLDPPGPGTEINHDCGFWTQSKETGGKWIAIPTKLVLVGITDRDLSSKLNPSQAYLVFKRPGDSLNGGAVLIPPLKLDRKEILKLRSGALPEVSLQQIEANLNYGDP